MENVPEILLIDKPKGITSFDVIRRLRRIYNIKKMGHAGTLDPLATGLMIIGVGPGTKKMEEYLKLDKTYIADVLIGQERDTGDLEGNVVRENKTLELVEDEVDRAVQSLQGVQELAVPKYSAIKKDGRPLYDYARKGEEVELPVKQMNVIRTALLDFYKRDDFYIARVLFEVGSGTYIRSLGEELGRRLAAPATLADLRRTKVGKWSVEEAEKLDL